MFAGFEPGARDQFFPRRRTAASAVTLLLHAFLVWGIVERERSLADAPGEEVEVAINDLGALVEEKPEEPEPEEEEPEPEFDEPPPSPTPRSKASRPQVTPDIVAPDKITEGADESNVDRGPVGGSGGSGSGVAKSTKEPPKEPAKAEPKPEPKPKPKKAGLPFDPNEPQAQLPQGAKPAKLKAGTAMTPVYPPDLRQQNITGLVTLRLLVGRQGEIKKVQILQKEASVEGDEKKQDWAKKKFLQAVVTLIKTWKYNPATYDGTPITVWVKAKFPFTLK